MTQLIPFPDLSVLVAGSCNTFGRSSQHNPTKCGAVVRLLPNGAADPSFSGDTNLIIAVAMGLQADGKIVVATSSDSALVRLLPNGNRDPSLPRIVYAPTFSPNGQVVGEPPTIVLGLVIDPWDDINVVGRFTSLQGIARKMIARVTGGASDLPTRLTSRKATGAAKVDVTVNGPNNYLVGIEVGSLDEKWSPYTNLILKGDATFSPSTESTNRFFRATVSRP